MSRILEADDLLAGLRTWRSAPLVVRELRRLYCGTLNRALAARIRAAMPATGPAIAALEDIRPDLARSDWTTPSLAFAYFADASSPAAIESELVRVCRTSAPDTVIAPEGAWPEYAYNALRVCEAGQRRDGRTTLLAPLSSGVSREACEAALTLLGDTWPEMSATVQLLVREVRFFATDDDASRSATTVEAFGAVFLRADTLSKVESLELLVHEATHLELAMRLAIDEHIAVAEHAAVSPLHDRARPLRRVLHACVAAARAAHALELALPHVVAEERREVEWRLRRMQLVLASDLQSLERAPWTETGGAFYASLREDARQLARHQLHGGVR